MRAAPACLTWVSRPEWAAQWPYFGSQAHAALPAVRAGPLTWLNGRPPAGSVG
ncbi:MAG: hypothetical protein HYR94_17550 [Chloroflexi bacterium]|nr:hypothetical protein [Chloroflexota bacterium]